MNFHYNILIGGTLLVGDQTLVDVTPGQSLFTTVFVSPRTLTTLLRGAPLTPNAVQNIDVQILRPGVAQPLANKMLKEGPRLLHDHAAGARLRAQQVPDPLRAALVRPLRGGQGHGGR